MAKKKKGKFSSFLNNPMDFTLLITIILLLGVGLVMLVIDILKDSYYLQYLD